MLEPPDLLAPPASPLSDRAPDATFSGGLGGEIAPNTPIPTTATGLPQPGQLIDRYVVEEALGQGGFAVVYRVRHHVLGTVHALKIPHIRQPAVLQRVVQEGRIQAGLRHPNVVGVTDLIEFPGGIGLLMDHVDGPPLDRWLAQHDPSPAQALALFVGIVQGVSAAHHRGIVHRDLKPANVILQGEALLPRVTDFGLARHLADASGGLTRTGQAMGSPGYMAPEQARNARDVDERADIFSLGCLLYRLHCGRKPFDGNSVVAVQDDILNGRYPPPESLRPGLAPAVVQTIQRCLSVKPAERPPDCESLLRLLGVDPEPARPAGALPQAHAPKPAGGDWAVLRLRADASGQLLTSSGGGAFVPVPGARLADLEQLRGSLSGIRSATAPLPREGLASFGGLRDSLMEAAHGAGALRLSAEGAGLDELPWEVLLGDRLAGAGGALHLSRVVASHRPVVPREVNGPLQVMVADALGPHDEVDALRRALGEARRSGEVAWLDPLEGPSVRPGPLVRRLREPPRPHVLVLRCALRTGSSGAVELRLGSAETDWITVDMLAIALDRKLCKELRVLVFDAACEDSTSGTALACRALASDGVAAVLGWALPVDPNTRPGVIARFISSLAGSAQGDVFEALAEARAEGGGAAQVGGVAPTLTLRGTESTLFRYERRVLQPRDPSLHSALEADEALSPAQARIGQALRELLAQPGRASLLLGDAIDPKGDRIGHAQLHRIFAREMERGAHESLASLMQSFELLEDRDELRALVQHTLEDVSEDEEAGRLRVVEGLAAMASPGLSLTLLWLPLLEAALARAHPDRRIIVLQPLRPGSLGRMKEFRREAGDSRWRRGGEQLERPDFERDFIVVRLFGGCATPGRSLHGDPVLTENDQLAQLAALDTLPDVLLAQFRRYPVAIAGLLPGSWTHREVLRRLTGSQPLPAGSMAVLPANATTTDERFWQWERGPSGGRGTVRVIRHRDLMAVTR